MRSVKKLSMFSAVACLLVAGSLQAQTATGGAWFTAVNGSSACFNPGTSQGSCFYTNPYSMRFSFDAAPAHPELLPPGGVNAFGPTWDVFCVDYFNEVNVNDQYTVNFTNLGANAADIPTATRGHTFAQYMAAAYLAGKIKAGTLDKNLGSGAIWWIMSGAPVTANGTDVTALGLEAEASWSGNVNPYEWVVVTDQAAAQHLTGGHQEFLTQVTPEPATLLLLGTGLVVMLIAAGAFRKPNA